ncbi:MAG: ABC transporter ATP-binding protein [Candidatus Omnitrophica bacterium CG11_big_fil_rev_8_21_14_0_20_64_10]|nr:MAG: ABC transporter ATP-binding protein [Candidatus Omnitrophica bacterium CG11_big_fil_rev_8_21_14_0_20_64_10]
MSADWRIRTEGLGKRYRIGRPEPYRNFRDALVELAAAPLRRLRGKRPEPNWIWALKGVSLEVPAGQVLGVIGRNGAGKTTLLKILSRITEPTEGVARVRGRLGSLLEVGTGFHPELTGRENIFLNGAILGMRRSEIRKKFDPIVAFSGVEPFIDTPVKRYSSGMFVRLAFAVAAHLEPEILLVDEVLAVGDAAFQKKCLGKMEQVARSGRTVLFVSHNLGAVEHLCDRVAWMDGGRLRGLGDPTEMIGRYLEAVTDGSLESRGTGPFQVERVLLQNEAGETTTTFRPGEGLTLWIDYRVEGSHPAPYLWLSIGGRGGEIFSANMALDGNRPEVLTGSGRIGCRFPEVPLLPQSYHITLCVREADGRRALFEPQEVAAFHVIGALRDYGLKDEKADVRAAGSVPLLLPYEWILPNGRRAPVRLGSGGRPISTEAGR